MPAEYILCINIYFLIPYIFVFLPTFLLFNLSLSFSFELSFYLFFLLFSFQFIYVFALSFPLVFSQFSICLSFIFLPYIISCISSFVPSLQPYSTCFFSSLSFLLSRISLAHLDATSLTSPYLPLSPPHLTSPHRLLPHITSILRLLTCALFSSPCNNHKKKPPSLFLFPFR